MRFPSLPPDTLETLCRFDTCTISNAIERLKVRLRNEGFIHGTVTCRFPDLPPVLGYAVTGRIRSSTAPSRGKCYYENIDFWRYVETVPPPRIIALQDCDHVVGLGALFGEVHARICRALRCVACVTNGAVRDLPAVEAVGLQLFSGSVSVTHAYAHVVDFGDAVELGGLRIAPGDLLHGDVHGVHSIPVEIASRLPAVAQQLENSEEELFRLCSRKDFSVEMLEAKLIAVETEVCG
ncbi:MAG TPA: RraA family protein [Bryobacteraceae bacterium]|nr:RraA family protein [Bryobacteraceae bacterium]